MFHDISDREKHLDILRLTHELESFEFTGEALAIRGETMVLVRVISRPRIRRSERPRSTTSRSSRWTTRADGRRRDARGTRISTRPTRNWTGATHNRPTLAFAALAGVGTPLARGRLGRRARVVRPRRVRARRPPLADAHASEGDEFVENLRFLFDDGRFISDFLEQPRRSPRPRTGRVREQPRRRVRLGAPTASPRATLTACSPRW